MTKELEVVKEMKIDNQDIVTVALAKIEAKIRKTVRESKEEAGSFKKEIFRMENEIPKIGNSNSPPGMKTKAGNLNKALKSSKLGKMAVWHVEHSCNFGLQENNYSFMLSRIDARGNFISGTTVISQVTPFTKSQLDFTKKIALYREKETAAIQRGFDAKASLNDMDAAERQMRAVVVEAELNKTKDGKILVKLLTDNYEETIKRISMS